jgi:ABC-2 type transport system permease protein
MGNALSTLTKGMVQAIAILGVGVLMGAELNANPLGWLGGLTLVMGFGLGFSGVALAMASRTNNPGAYHAMIMVFNLPMLFLSNALYPLDAMPTWMKIGTLINPTTYTVDGLRQMMFRAPVSSTAGNALPLWLCWLVVMVFAVAGMGMATSAFRKSVK